MNDDPAAVAVEACIPDLAGSDLTAEIEAIEEESAPWKLPPKILD